MSDITNYVSSKYQSISQYVNGLPIKEYTGKLNAHIVTFFKSNSYSVIGAVLLINVPVIFTLVKVASIFSNPKNNKIQFEKLLDEKDKDAFRSSISKRSFGLCVLAGVANFGFNSLLCKLADYRMNLILQIGLAIITGVAVIIALAPPAKKAPNDAKLAGDEKEKEPTKPEVKIPDGKKPEREFERKQRIQREEVLRLKKEQELNESENQQDPSGRETGLGGAAGSGDGYKTPVTSPSPQLSSSSSSSSSSSAIEKDDPALESVGAKRARLAKLEKAAQSNNQTITPQKRNSKLFSIPPKNTPVLLVQTDASVAGPGGASPSVTATSASSDVPGTVSRSNSTGETPLPTFHQQDSEGHDAGLDAVGKVAANATNESTAIDPVKEEPVQEKPAIANQTTTVLVDIPVVKPVTTSVASTITVESSVASSSSSAKNEKKDPAPAAKEPKKKRKKGN